MKTQSTSILLSLLFATTLSLTISAQTVGDDAPDFTLKKLDGGNFTLTEQTGKVVFIFLFGNGCPHCYSNGPNTQTDIYNIFKDNPNFVAVGIDTWDGNASAVQSFKTTTGIEYTLLLKGSKVQTDYKTTYDRIIIVDAEGTIQYKATTNADKNSTAAASSIISDLLEETSGIQNKQSESKQFFLAPNTVKNQLIINNPFNIEQLVNIEIVNLTGKIVFAEKLELQNENYVNISSLQPGYFTLIIRNKNDYRIAKFVKIR